MPLHLGLDVGTQATKALLYDSQQRRVVGRGACPTPLLRSERPGCAEQHPQQWKEAVKVAVRQALDCMPQREKVCSIGVSGQQHGMVVLDESGNVIRPAKLWCDTESTQEARELSKALGFTLVPSFTATKLLWLKRNEPQAYAAARHLLLPASYINFWLTGSKAMEAGDASGTGFLDVAQQRWDERAMSVVDDKVPTLVPRLVGPGQSVGTLLPDVASELGLEQGAVVSAGSGDNACSALGAGVTSDGQLVMSLGTSATLFAMSSHPVLDPSGTVAPFCDATGAWLPLICLLNCTSVMQEVCSLTGQTHEQLTEAASLIEPGCKGVTFLPYLAGERTPNWPHATGTVLGLRPGLATPGLLYRAALEGVTLAMLAGYRRMQALGLGAAPDIRLVGGGSRNALWRQVVADAFQLPVRIPAETETAALGAALQGAACWSGADVAQFVAQHQQMEGQEVVLPRKEAAAAYEEALGRLQTYGQTLFG